jgi:hypothetical protein
VQSTQPARRAGRLTALFAAIALLAAPLAAVPAVVAAPSAAAATTTSLTITTIPTKTAPYKKKVTVTPSVKATGKVTVKSKTLTVKKSGKTVATNKKSVALAPGTYKVTTKVTYKTYTVKKSTKVWSSLKVKSKTQTLVVKQGKKPSRTSPASAYNCPSWAPVKGNQTTSHTSDWIYHVPGGRYYKVTKPEECFTTASAARKAGYRASKNG